MCGVQAECLAWIKDVPTKKQRVLGKIRSCVRYCEVVIHQNTKAFINHPDSSEVGGKTLRGTKTFCPAGVTGSLLLSLWLMVRQTVL